MGSTPSTPNRESSANNNTSDNPWWQIENQILELNPNTMEASSNDPNSSSSHRSESDQQGAQIDETETLISDNFECEDNSNNNEDRNDVASSPMLNESSENGVENICSDSSADVESNLVERVPNVRQQSLEEFKEELRIKREMRTSAIAELRRQLAHEKEINKQLIEERSNGNLCEICSSIYNSIEQNDSNEAVVECAAKNGDGDNAVAAAAAAAASVESNRTTNITLRSQTAEVQFALQNANAEILRISGELAATRQQAKSLKEVIAMSKEIIEIRETELTQLKSKLKDIENSLAERELHTMSENLRQEYDRQLVNIRNLRALYEERARISAAEKENLNRQLETSRAELNAAVEKNKNLEEHIESLNADLKSSSVDLYATKEKLAYYQAENRNLHDEMTVINQLFGQLLAGFNGNNTIDIDKLTAMLEENRDLLNDITSKENCKEGAAQIPKLIFDLVSQADKKSDDADSVIESSSTTTSSADECSADGGAVAADSAAATGKVSSAQEIIHNLPKVWRVLIELLNHQQLKPVPLQGSNPQELCYKSIQTETGPQMVLSVSKTFIRLKDLIMEKKFLQKETKKLKNLNSHLENRLEEQESRLSAVSVELNKTWNLVGRMQRQHRQLHTHEQVLRYQLQQKRRMLNELKEELEYCRRKWTLAKQKNNESQSQWESLRNEFSQRKENDLNNSGESGYSDSPASEDDDDDDDDEEEEETSVSIISTESARNSRMKKKSDNLEKFLLAPDQIDRNKLRIHSVSPVRTARMNIARRNSDSQVTTQFATEVFQVSSDVVQPLVHVCTECDENSAKNSVHFADTDAKVDRPVAAEQAQVIEVRPIEPIVCNAKKPELTNAQKLIEAKASTSKTKMYCELRKTGAITKLTQKTTSSSSTTTKAKAEESLEEMFLRLSGSGEAETMECQSSDETVSEKTTEEEKEEARAAKKLAQIERLEDQCKQLMAQVMRASNRGDELNKRADTAHNKFKVNFNLVSNQPNTVLNEPVTTINLSNDTKPSASGHQNIKTDEQCLTPTEQQYLARRDERLKRLEAESQAHLNRMKSMHLRTASVDTKIDSLRKRAGDTKVALANIQTRFDNIAAGNLPPCTSNEPNQSTPENNELNRSEQSAIGMNTAHRAASVDTKLDTVHLESSSSSPSSSKTDDQLLSEAEREYLARRDGRLKRLEAEAQAYMSLVKSTQRRSVDVDTKLEFLHGRYDSDSDGASSSLRPSYPDAVATNETKNAVSDEQQQQQESNSMCHSETKDILSDDTPYNEPSNEQDENETNHSSSETIPNTTNDESNENSTN